MSLLFLSVCLFLFSFLLSFTFHVPCNPLCGSMSWIRNLWCDSSRRKKKKKKEKKKSPAIPNTHLIFYTTKWLLFAEKKRQRKKKKNIQRLWLPVSSDSSAFASNIAKNSHWRFSVSTVWLTLAQRQGGQPVSLPGVGWVVRCHPPPTHYVAQFLDSPYTMWMLITTFWTELMQETWPLGRGQVHQVLQIPSCRLL